MSNEKERQSPPQVTIQSTRYRLRRASATVERLKRPQPDEWTTSEHRIAEALELNDGGLTGIPSGNISMRSVLGGATTRPHSQLEGVLRIIVGAGLILTLASFFAEAFLSWGGNSSSAPVWREVTVRIASAPKQADVFVGEKRRGETPLTTTEYCRGRNIRIRVQAPGYVTWAWHGLCPQRGDLVLKANLRPQ